MFSSRPLLPLLMLAATGSALETDWNGMFSEPIYGGNINVCVSEVNGVFYGQATFSWVGYMRGTIDSSGVFSGDYWTMGFEALQGTFELTLVGSAYSGSFTQLPAMTYSTSGTQLSTATPSDENCQRSDDYLLTSSEYYSSTGSYNSFGEQGIIIAESAAGLGTTYGSYQYTYADGSLVYGNDYMTSYLNGQVKAGRWSETGEYEGINMYVAKNSTHHYTAWWFISRMADFDYSLSTDADIQGSGMFAKTDDVYMADLDADEYLCYSLPTADAEEDCVDSSDEDDDDEGTSAHVLTTMAFSILSFIAILVFGGVILSEVKKRPVTANSSSDGIALQNAK
jgi:hypothetical protein